MIVGREHTQKSSTLDSADDVDDHRDFDTREGLSDSAPAPAPAEAPASASRLRSRSRSRSISETRDDCEGGF